MADGYYKVERFLTKTKWLHNTILPYLLILPFVTLFLLPSFCTTTPSAKDTSLYIFAHQDDDILISARMKEELKNRINIYCIWITAGEKSAPADVREKEAREAMRIIGVPDKNLYFLGFPDQEAHLHLKEIIEKVIAIIKKIKPNRIYVCAYEGGNIDHDTANFVAYEAARRSKHKIELFEFPLYNYFDSKYRVNEFIPNETSKTLFTELTDEQIELREELCNIYKSQKMTILAARMFFNESKSKEGEPYRKLPKYDYLTPPHKGPLFYEVGIGLEIDKKKLPKFEDFKKMVEEYYKSIKGK